MRPQVDVTHPSEGRRDRPAPLLRAGETCWRVARAGRVAFLVDGEACFSAMADAFERAERNIWLVGWDFHSAVRLRRTSAHSDRPDKLVPLLDTLVRERPDLRVRVLAWDFAMLYALEREVLPLFQFGAKTHRRIHFAMDSAHPVGASQHQKIVVVDDAVGFVGGLDLTAHRWDTRAHRPDDPRRVDPSGRPYPPFHDVQIAVDGEAAAALGVLARERWRRATGHRVDDTAPARVDPWPAALDPDVRNVSVGIARTLPQHGSQREVREVETLYREGIAAARRWIYIENQYLTSPRISGWLAGRLREPTGPEIVIVGPRENHGWLEESTMGALRDRAVRELRAADPGDRLRVLHPGIPGLPDDQILNVHAKLMVVDDRLARVGSANISNRSMGLDSECDVALEAGGRDDVRRAIAAFRDGLLAEHLGVDAACVAKEIARHGSLVRAVDALRGRSERTLVPLEVEASDWTAEVVDALGAVDPEHPIPLEELVARLQIDGDRLEPRGIRSPWTFTGALLLIAGVAIAWSATPLGDYVTADRLAHLLEIFRTSWYGPVAATGVFVLASLLLVPITALTVAAGLSLGAGTGIVVAWVGGVVAATIGHQIGRWLWRDTVRRLAGRRLNRLSQRLAERGIVSTALLRMMPVAPFMVVNLVAGASLVRARDFVLGTALGLAPGTVLLILTADSIKTLLAEPSGPAWLWAGVTVLALVGAATAVRRYLARRPPADAAGSG